MPRGIPETKFKNISSMVIWNDKYHIDRLDYTKMVQQEKKHWKKPTKNETRACVIYYYNSFMTLCTSNIADKAREKKTMVKKREE
jgi:hypothetical protein